MNDIRTKITSSRYKTVERYGYELFQGRQMIWGIMPTLKTWAAADRAARKAVKEQPWANQLRQAGTKVTPTSMPLG